MENFIYYVQIGNQKKGPLTVDELRQLRVSPTTLIWRNDSPNWLLAKHFEEIRNSLVDIPPLLPQEIKKNEGKKIFEKSKIVLFKFYIIASICLGILTSIIAIVSFNSWEGKGHESEFGPNTQLSYTLRYSDPQIGWNYSRNNEDAYASEQLFILRPLYPFFSAAYLTNAEQDNYILVFIKQIVSSFLLLGVVFLLIFGIKYFQSQNN